MTDLSVKPIASPQQVEISEMNRIQGISTEQALSKAEQTKALAVVAAQPNALQTVSNVSIQFKVDDKTQDVTVYLVDRQSKKVLRSIPASDLSKIQISDLLKITA